MDCRKIGTRWGNPRFPRGGSFWKMTYMIRGKIAQLPDEIREELNARLDDGGDGKVILDWLNALPEVRAALDEEFDGKPVNKQNLSEWRRGGFAEWRTRRELLEQAVKMMDCAGDIDELADDLLVDHVATVLAAQYARVMADWNGEPQPKFEAKARMLRGLCQDVVRLQRSVHQATEHRYVLEQLREKKDQREIGRAKTEVLAPIMKAIRKKSLTQVLGGTEEAATAAEFVAEIQSIALPFRLPEAD
jgi:hypothetical protein